MKSIKLIRLVCLFAILASTITLAQTNTTPRLQPVSSVSSTGTAPKVTLNPGSLDFGTVLLSAVKTTTLTNAGSTTLSIASITVTGANFTQQNNCGRSVLAGHSCVITVTVTAHGIAGPVSGNVSITDNGQGSPQHVSLAASIFGLPCGSPCIPGRIACASACPCTISGGSITVFRCRGYYTKQEGLDTLLDKDIDFQALWQPESACPKACSK